MTERISSSRRLSRRAMRVVFALAICAATAVAQRTWIVDWHGGAGVDFTDIPPAIAAARAGDRVVVRAGSTFHSYSATTLGKGLDLETTDGATVTSLTVDGVPGAEWARVTGFDVWPGILQISHCPGPVLVASVVTGNSSTPQGCMVQDCSAVSFLDSQLASGETRSSFSVKTALLAANSRILLQRCRVIGLEGSNGHYALGPATVGGAGIMASDSDLAVIACWIQGGRGGTGYTLGDCYYASGADGGAGVRATDSTAFVMTSVVIGGAGGFGATHCRWGVQGLAVATIGTGSAQVTQDSRIDGGLSGASLVPPVPGIVSPITAQRGQPATLTFFGPPSTFVMVFFDVLHGHVPIAGGIPALLTATATPLHAIVIAANGLQPVTIPVPNDPVLADQFAFFQGAAFPPGAPPTLTNLGDVRIR